MSSTLKSQRCSFGRQPSLAPLHEAFAHGRRNYSVFPEHCVYIFCGDSSQACPAMNGKKLYPFLHGWWLEFECPMEDIMIPLS